MKTLLQTSAILLASILPAFALTCPSGLIEVSDSHLVDATTGAAYAGNFTITQTYDSVAGTSTVLGDQQSVSVTGGTIDRCLAPGNFTVRRKATGSGLTITNYWLVPVSGGPYTVPQVQTATPANPSLTILLSQLSTDGATTGDCIIFNGTQWAIGSCGSGPTLFDSFTGQFDSASGSTFDSATD